MLTDDEVTALRDEIRVLECESIRVFDDEQPGAEAARRQLAVFDRALELVKKVEAQGTHPWLTELAERVRKNYAVALEYFSSFD